MPSIYLSPSLQPYNKYVNGGDEQYYMNLVADAMEPYLNASGITFSRRTLGTPLGQAIRDSNSGYYDLHLALHSNAAPESLAGKLQGTDVYYYPYSANGRRAADIIAENFRKIYPDPNKVRTVPTTKLAEITKTNAPAVLIEVAYHDNTEDAEWIRQNINAIAKNLVQSLTQYFGIPFVEPQPVRTGRVVTEGGNLNIRNKPGLDGAVIGKIPNGVSVTIFGETGNWYVVTYGGIEGYSSKDFIRV